MNNLGLIFSARMVSAEEALHLGLVTQVVAHEQLEETVLALAEKLAKGPTSAYALAKKLVNKSFEISLAAALHDEGMAQAISGSSQDFQEGLAAFQEKRPANFQGR